jgi:hypothetical protein
VYAVAAADWKLWLRAGWRRRQSYLSGDMHEEHSQHCRSNVDDRGRCRRPGPGQEFPHSYRDRFECGHQPIAGLDSSDKVVETVATGGKGGASGNAGGIAAYKNLLAVVNFGSNTVSIFEHYKDSFVLKHTIPTTSSPLSVAFGHDHLYVLGATTIESHQAYDGWVSPSSDGEAALLHADGTAAQVGVLDHELIFSEKSNAIETVPLGWDFAIAGVANLVSDIPTNVNAPFGLVTRDNEAYVTIAHANEISLVRHDAVVTVTGSGTQNAPCWLALDRPFLFSSNSPSQTVSRYAVYGEKIVQDAAVVASFVGDPTDIAYHHELAAVIDGGVPDLLCRWMS